MIYLKLAAIHQKQGPITALIQGGARGADSIARQAAQQLNIYCKTYHADWKTYGRAGGPIRNRMMLDTKPDLVVAFHDNLDASRGTKDCVTEAKRRGIPVVIYGSKL